MLPTDLKKQFVAAIGRMLRPVVRQLIAYGVSYPAFDRIVRQVYVDVAQEHFALAFKRQTDSRISLLTGINRKEIPRLREARQAPVEEVEATLTTNVIGRWMEGPPYAAASGQAHRLPYDSERARAPSFTRLVRELDADTPVRAVLDELLRTGAVELLPNGDVVRKREAHIPAGDVQGKLTLLGSDPGELFATIVHNIEHPDAPRLQRKVVYDNIGADALKQLRTEAQRAGEEFIRRANALLAAYDRDRHPEAPGGKRMRVVLGAYYFDEEIAPESPEPAGAATKPPGRIRRSR
jgi:hypothetical protein